MKLLQNIKKVLTNNNAYANIKKSLNKQKGKNKMKKQENKRNKFNGILGLLLLLVVLSIAYSSYTVSFGTTGLTPKIMLVPQVLFAASLLGYVFYKAFNK